MASDGAVYEREVFLASAGIFEALSDIGRAGTAGWGAGSEELRRVGRTMVRLAPGPEERLLLESRETLESAMLAVSCADRSGAAMSDQIVKGPARQQHDTRAMREREGHTKKLSLSL